MHRFLVVAVLVMAPVMSAAATYQLKVKREDAQKVLPAVLADISPIAGQAAEKATAFSAVTNVSSFRKQRDQGRPGQGRYIGKSASGLFASRPADIDPKAQAVPAVPLPAGGWVLLTALGLMGFIAKFRRV